MSFCFILSLISLYALSLIPTHLDVPQNSTSSNLTRNFDVNFTGYFDTLIAPQSLTAVLPILPGSLHRTLDLLAPFLAPQEHVHELVIVCPDAIVSGVRLVLQGAFASLGSAAYPDISLRPSQNLMGTTFATLRAAADATTDWVLIMDDKGLTGIPQSAQSTLLNPPPASLPFGPLGELLPGYEPIYFPQIRPAKYLLPPFVMPTSLASIETDAQVHSSTWVDFGIYIAKHRPDAIGGIVLLDSFNGSSSIHSNGPVLTPESKINESLDPMYDDAVSQVTSPSFITSAAGVHFIFFFPIREDLRRVLPLICRIQLQQEVMEFRILVYDDNYTKPHELAWEVESVQAEQCIVKYEILTGRIPLSFSVNGSILLSKWLGTHAVSVDVVVTLQEYDPLVAFLLTGRKIPPLHRATVIQIPRLDLDHMEWMSSLSLEEWRNWHIPRIDISVITKDRPQSLLRLLKSLSETRYFGDSLDLRINVEQDCDAQTLEIAGNLTWPFGQVFIHHRIIHGGLLPGVVESWYPKSNNSYGLLLEDDIELSPLSYAWIKMTLLRYRYGDAANRIPNMFGISLYQQKHLELRPSGLRSFNPRALFSEAGLVHPTTPYLSQVPCSWGAVYFPEHWREFHQYLPLRLEEKFMKIKDHIVLDVRSNRWTKSWKKFFIELIYLRGYVMLYPNYEDFLSFSTNHLEVGSHVKVRSRVKKDLFLLPLMQLEDRRKTGKLLDLPNRTLPPGDMLPVLNLTGFLSSLEEIVQRGKSRRSDLTSCDKPCEFHDIRSLMCGCRP